MTKMKSKKITKSTFAVIIMAIAMVALLAFGGTYAYFTASVTSQSGSFKTGVVVLKATEEITISGTNLVPGKDLTGGNAIVYSSKSTDDTVSSNVKRIVFVEYSYTVSGGVKFYDAESNEVPAVVRSITTERFTELETGVYYVVLEANNVDDVTFADSLKFNPAIAANSADGEVAAQMGVTVTVTLEASAIQYEEIAGADEAAIVANAWTALGN